MNPPRAIDLNCDLGEYPEHAERDDALLALITSANIACGGHAGDRATMERTVRAALGHGVAIGAHPGYPDRANFGRAELLLAPAEVERFVFEQVGALAAVARSLGAALTHAKPHGSLYHAVAARPEFAAAFAAGAARAAPGLVLFGPAASLALEVWARSGHACAPEAFADRAYDGAELRPRSRAGALISDPAAAAAQALRIARGERPEGGGPPFDAQTICIHSDTPNAPAIARAVRLALEAARFRIAPVRPGATRTPPQRPR